MRGRGWNQGKPMSQVVPGAFVGCWMSDGFFSRVCVSVPSYCTPALRGGGRRRICRWVAAVTASCLFGFLWLVRASRVMELYRALAYMSGAQGTSVTRSVKQHVSDSSLCRFADVNYILCRRQPRVVGMDCRVFVVGGCSSQQCGRTVEAC